MERLAQQNYDTSLSQYADTISTLKSKLEQKTLERKARIEDVLASKAKEKIDQTLVGNLIKQSELREKQEALSSFAIQAGLAGPAIKKLAGLASKGISSLGSDTSVARSLATAESPLSESPISALQQAQAPSEIEMTPTNLQSLRTKIRSAKITPREPISEGSGQVGKVGQSFEQDPESLAPSTEAKSALQSGAETNITGEIEGGVGAAGEEIAGGEGLAEAGALVAGEAAAEAGLAAALGPISVVAGLGFGAYELGKAFDLWGGSKDSDKPPPPPPVSQAMKQNIGVPVHRALSVAPTLNSALIQAGR